MKMAFAIKDMGKIKRIEKIITWHKDDFRLED